MAQQEFERKASAIDVLLSIREKNRRIPLQEYLRKVGLGKFDKLARKKNSQNR